MRQGHKVTAETEGRTKNRRLNIQYHKAENNHKVENKPKAENNHEWGKHKVNKEEVECAVI